MKKLILFLVFSFTLSSYAIAENAKWISTPEQGANEVNTWIAFRKNVKLNKIPQKAMARIAADSKYWLWVNGEIAVFEGSLKRGPSPTSSYYDEVDLAPYLKKGTNQIALLLWHFGKEGFSHKNSGKSGLFFDAPSIGISSDRSWLCRKHPAFETADNPAPNFRLPESNIRFNAPADIRGWQTADCKKSFGFKKATIVGTWNGEPWGKMVKRPIPFWKDFGIKTAPIIHKTGINNDTIIAQLPYNMQMTPIIELIDNNEGSTISICTDHLRGGGDINNRAEYVTIKGAQNYESLGWLSGQQIILTFPKSVNVKSVKYRETGYDSYPEGSFSCDDDFFMRFWQKGLRTLYVNMRDTYFDCPDRERAQWWGDVTVLTGECFYTYSTSTHALMRKAIDELCAWQKPDGALFSPVPAGNYSDELPGQMLASVGKYGFWNYYLNTGDHDMLEKSYPSVKKYLSLWTTDSTGLTAFRNGGWTWGDWGFQKDMRLIFAGLHYLALDGASKMAQQLGLMNDVAAYKAEMEKVKAGYNRCWNGYAYRHPEYQGETDDRVQALAVLAGIASTDKYPQILNLLKTQMHASPYMEKYVMEALFQMGQGTFAMQRAQKRFAQMVNDPVQTTLFEGWDIGNNSFGGGTTNHAWSGGPLTVIAQYLCGISPVEPGYKTFMINPQPATFKKSNITVPTVAGNITSSWALTDDKMEWKIIVPNYTKAYVAIPSKNINNITVNGDKGTPADLQNISGKTIILLDAGTYEISVEKPAF